MEIPKESIVIDTRKIERKHRAFIKTGTVINSQDGKTKYQVQIDGSWRRIRK
jgi:hypothetical protein